MSMTTAGKRGMAAIAIAGVLTAYVGDAGAGGKAAHQRPYSGSCATQLTWIDAPITMTIDTSCRFTHLGLTAGEAYQWVTGMLPNGDFTFENENIYTAANGDELWATFDGVFHDNGDGTIHYWGTQTYVGGSGRFENAAGTSTLDGTASLVTTLGSFTERGVLSY